MTISQSFRKKLSRTLLLVIISFSFPSFSSPWTEDTLFIMPKERRTPWLEAINEAKISTNMAAYRLSDPEIINALEKASLRGVKIDLLLERDAFGHDKTNNVETPVERLAPLNKLKIYHLSEDFKQAHYKMAVIDDKFGLIGTGNLDEESFEGIAGKEKPCRDFVVTIPDVNTVKYCGYFKPIANIRKLFLPINRLFGGQIISVKGIRN